MNSEQIKTEAQKVITNYLRKHNSFCYLKISGSKVVALPLSRAIVKIDPKLILSPYEQINGCRARKWDGIGSALLNLYNEACEKISETPKSAKD